ncbi:hypothetical protein DICPUDRAFT_158630 [Dictyostelium purpureum]|uniref:Fe2OG dioxygenase domain-containing protein n=1 Tax=Dictyostelium purpureum TaxID=5786 RepID=F1A237_DICPU|nr:uncharacterized protein DICPUDRAFT_158630 [Dictyostelium purpureum]EGC29741.1 hypothetical protein DICPUDRAFT_158630 [Dictyostelium purpureum]|eukprot:XP_003293734.1 hypothetical protein DICPUDRAFT_158630 [Dictyostelium purpureum]
MISSKATPLTEFKLSNKDFKESSLTVQPIVGVEDGIVIKNLLNEEECHLIDKKLFIENDNKEYIKHGLRIHKNSKEFADTLFERINKYCVKELTKKSPTNPDSFDQWQLKTVSDKFRFIRYNVGEEFPNHVDGEARPSSDQMSFFSLLVFTNEGGGKDFTGGEFRFFKKDSNLQLVEIASVKPEKGLAIVFPHGVIHDSVTISNGTKHSIRTDVVYSLKK